MTTRPLAVLVWWVAAWALLGPAPADARPASKPRVKPATKKVARPKVIDMPSPNKNSRGKAKIDTIVIHHTAGKGTAEDIGRFFQQRSSRVSAHYTIGKTGTIVQSVQEKDRAWHAGVSE